MFVNMFSSLPQDAAPMAKEAPNYAAMFSQLARQMDKDAVKPAGARIVRHPGKHSGHVQLTLCTPAAKLENQTITRSSKAAYKQARKAEWGDLWTGVAE